MEQSRALAAGLAGLDQAGVEAYQAPAELAAAEARTDAACSACRSSRTAPVPTWRSAWACSRHPRG